MRGWLMLVAAPLLSVALAFGAGATADARTVRVAIPSDVGNLTPYGRDTGYALMSLVYDTLTLRDERGVPRPWLARSVRRQAGGRSVVVRLRRGVRWHDGRPLTADDVAFTFRYLADRPQARFTPQLTDIRSVTASGALTVRFDLRRASLGFDDQPLADVPILPRHLWEGLPPGRRAPPGPAVGSGPYRLVRHDSGRRYVFAANRRYFFGVHVTRLDMPIVRQPQKRLELLDGRAVDAIPVSLPGGVEPPVGAGSRFAVGVSYSGTMLLFNTVRPPFDVPVARRAVARALDLAYVAGDSGGSGSIAPATNGALHPRSPWASAEKLERYDAATARVQLADQGVRTFAILVAGSDPLRSEAARRVAVALSRVGVRARIGVLSPSRLSRAMDGGRFDAAVVGISPLVSYDPSFLRALFGDPDTTPLNDGRYRSAAFDRLAAGVAAATTRAARRRAVAAELRLLARDVPALPLFFGGTTFAYNPSAFDGWTYIRGSGILDKQSLLNHPPTRQHATPAGDPTDRALGGSDDGFSLVPIIIAAAALMAAGSAWWIVRGRRA